MLVICSTNVDILNNKKVFVLAEFFFLLDACKVMFAFFQIRRPFTCSKFAKMRSEFKERIDSSWEEVRMFKNLLKEQYHPCILGP